MVENQARKLGLCALKTIKTKLITEKKVKIFSSVSKYTVMFKEHWNHSKMTSPPKCQILDLSLPYVAVGHFFHYTPFPLCYQANCDELFA